MNRILPAVVGIVCILIASTLAAQQPTAQQWQQLQRLRQAQQPNVQWENTELSGSIKGLQGSMIQVAAGGNENWLVQVEARPQDIGFQGTADPAFVKAGMLVEFKAKLNKRGHAAEPVTQLTIFTVRDGRGVGVQPEGGASKDGELFAPRADEEKKPVAKGKPEDPVYQVAGQITKLSRGEMTINCAGTVIKADLDKEATIVVDVNHLQWAQLGDKIDLRARYIMGKKGEALATQVTVVGATVLGEPKKRVLPGTKPDAETKEAEEKEEK